MLLDPLLTELQDKINYHFQNIENLTEALTHPSYPAENRLAKRDNQRLEFLGDAVIQIIITEKLYFLFQDWPEGELTKVRAALSKESTLAQFGREIELGKYLRVGHGERLSKGYERNSVLCDAFEALIGAIFIDCKNKLNIADRLVNELIDGIHSQATMENLVKTENPKGLLQEWSQKSMNETPEYKTLEELGPDHQKTFTVGVYIKRECLGVGRSGKRQTAETIAARQALQKVTK